MPNTYWVVAGRILAGEYPGGADPAETRPRLGKLREAGVDRYIDLTEEGELPPYAHFLPKNIEYLRSAIVDCSVPYNVSQTRTCSSSLHSALAQDRCVYVHCRAGIGRTGVIMGCFLADRESNGRAALKILNRALAPERARRHLAPGAADSGTGRLRAPLAAPESNAARDCPRRGRVTKLVRDRPYSDTLLG